MCFEWEGAISTLSDNSLKLVDKFIYLGSSVSSIESHVSVCLAKAWTAIDRLLIIWKSDLSDKIKLDFFQAVTVSILLYGCTKLTLTKHIEKRLDENYTQILQAIQEATPNEKTAIQPLTFHLQTHPR